MDSEIKNAPGQATSKHLTVRLYVAGSAPNSLRAIANVRAICEQHFAAAHDIEVVDMLEHPQRALEDLVIVTPTLIRIAPPPTLRVIGTLCDTDQVVVTLAGA